MATTAEESFSFNSTSTISEDFGSPTEQGGEDMVVKEEAKEWKETHNGSPGLDGPSPASTCSSSIPQTSPNYTGILSSNLSPITPIKSSYSSSSFGHFRMTSSGLIDMGIGTPNSSLLEAQSQVDPYPRCENCQKLFSSVLKLSGHTCERYKCGECNFRTSDVSHLGEHLKNHKHNIPLYKCGICDLALEDVASLQEHLSQQHDEPYTCTTCNTVFVSKEHYHLHNTTPCVITEECGECGLVFDKSSALKEHMTQKHSSPITSTPVLTPPSSTSTPGAGGTPLPATDRTPPPTHTTTNDLLTDITLSTQALLLRHKLQQLVNDIQNGFQERPLPAKPVPRFPEPITSMTSNVFSKSVPILPNTASTTLFHPTAVKANSVPSIYPLLLKNDFVTPENIRAMLKTQETGKAEVPDLRHEGGDQGKGLTCPVCPMMFTSVVQLQYHIILHQYMSGASNKSHKCSDCSQEFLTKQLLEEHQKTEHEVDRPFKCTHCDKTFTRSNNLQEHLRTHTGSRPYSCNFCDKSFARSSILHIHLRTHTKVKPFQCSVCPAAFSHSNSLQAHHRRHTGAKPYICPVCSKAFRQSGTLHRHIRTHNKTKPTRTNVSVPLKSMATPAPPPTNEKFNIPMQLPANYTTLFQDLNKAPSSMPFTSSISLPVTSMSFSSSPIITSATGTPPVAAAAASALSPVSPPPSSTPSYLAASSAKPTLFTAPSLLNKENHPDIQASIQMLKQLQSRVSAM